MTSIKNTEKTNKLDDLFDRWCEIEDYKNKFIRDGIIFEPIFDNTSPKLLFLAKEGNTGGEPEKGDFRDWWRQDVQFNFSHRICEWAYGCLNNFPPLSSHPEDTASKIKILKSIAFMNLKKVGGKAQADHKIIKETIEKERSFILEEISIINPDIIIGGIGKSEFWYILFDGIKFEDTGYDIKVAKHKSYKIIDFYHPSYRVPKAMSYSLLQNVFRSEEFNNL